MMKRLFHIVLVLLLLSACGSREAQRMHHLLQLIDTQNKCDTVFRSDSIQRLLVDYYDSHGTANEKMLAYYLLGRACQDTHDYPYALNNFQMAANQADTSGTECNYALLSRVYAQMSDVTRGLSPCA